MNGRRPQASDAVIRRVQASLADRAGDYSITPAFVERVRRLRDRRRLVLRAVQATAAVIVVAVAGVGIFTTLRPSRHLDFVSPPPATASPTAPTPSPEPSAAPLAEPSAPTAAEPRPSSPPTQEPDQGPDAAPPPADGSETDGETGGEDRAAAGPRPTRVVLDGEPRPGAVCRDDEITLIATIDLPEAETGYVIDLAEPVTMRIMGEGFTDVSDTVDVLTDGDQTVYTARFITDNNDFEVDEVRVEGPTDPAAC